VGAAWSFFQEGDPAAEAWVHDKALAVLQGQAGVVAAAIRRKATTLNLDSNQRAKADRAADYLLNKRPYLDYPTALTNGWPIATGVIEGACRHLIKDRMDITGARWGLQGAEAILKLRAIRSNGDFPAYWDYHLAQERHRHHDSRHADGVIPRAARRPSRRAAPIDFPAVVIGKLELNGYVIERVHEQGKLLGVRLLESEAPVHQRHVGAIDGAANIRDSHAGASGGRC